VFAGRALLRSLLVGAAAVTLLLPAGVAQADPSPTEIQAQIDKGNAQLELVVEQYNKINGDLAATQASLTALQAKVEPLKTSMDKAYADVDRLAATAYKTASGLRTMSVLLSARSSDAFVDQYTTLQQVSRSQQQDLAAFTAAKRGYDLEKKRLDNLLAVQNAQKADLATKKTKIEGDIARLDAMQDKVNAQIARDKAAAAANSNNNTTGKSNTATPKTPPKSAPKATPKPAKPGPVPKVSGSAGKAVAYAYAQLNKRYVYGTAGPNTFDCSGLTMMAWKAGGVPLPHNAAQQWSRVRHISRGQLMPGDLVFYNGLGHVGIYIGNNQIIHAPNSRTVVKVASINADPIYGYGRP
jgi:cell wall-associated NlpC family hydrolase